ncbi:MAG: tyrosine--tRNA ligase [Planctomycetota bacterium]|nr:tyrosine--tRNA ligase [Planctomycetota bacterium]
MDLLETLKKRGFVEQMTDEAGLIEHLAKGPSSVYIGFDPTADSLHCGSMVPLMALAHLQRAGHRVLPLVGGATGLIGDPSGKTELRKLLSAEQIKKNIEGLKEQIGRFISFEKQDAKIVNNADWFAGRSYIEFLRDVGRHFSVNRMLANKTYKDRFEGENGLNFIEFNYQLFQAFDFMHLYKEEGCRIQMGGNDQWGNICAGVDLIRRVLGKDDAFAVTFPLITTSSGAKMGKTADGAIWLDAARTSPHDFFQYWRNVPDTDVDRFLKLFTFLELSEIADLTKDGGQALNAAKEKLAFEVTKIVHGEAEANKAKSGARGEVSAMPTVTVNKSDFDGDGQGILNVFSKIAEMAKSNGDVRRAIQGGGLYVNDEKVTDPKGSLTLADFNDDGDCFLRFGKKKKKRLKLA